jgi:hypothetical protein
MSYNPRRPRMVLADPTHPDYSRYTLRNGTTNPRTLQSFYNQPDLTNYVNSQERMAGFYYQHPMKDNRLREKPVIYNQAPYGRSMNTDARDEIKSYRGEVEGTAETFLNMISRNPNLLNTLDKQNKYKELVDRKTKELNEKVPFNIPNREQVIEDLVKRFMIKQFEKDILETGVDVIKPINEVRDRLQQLISMQLRQEQTTVETLGGGAVDVIPQSRKAVQTTQKTNLRTSLLLEKERLSDIKKRKRIAVSDKLEIFHDLLNLPYPAEYNGLTKSDDKSDSLIKNLKYYLSEIENLKYYNNPKINETQNKAREKSFNETKSKLIVEVEKYASKRGFKVIGSLVDNLSGSIIQNRLNEIEDLLPDAPDDLLLPDAPIGGFIGAGAGAGAGVGAGSSGLAQGSLFGGDDSSY